MKTRLPALIVTLVLVIGASAIAIWKNPLGGDPADHPAAGAAAVSAEYCAEHQIPESDCPWCDPSLLVSLGFCRGHGVPEALCVRCDPRLEAGFRAEGDWCAGHALPESQCLKCGAVLPDPPDPGAAASSAEEGGVQVLADPEAEARPGAPVGARALRAPDPDCVTGGLLVQLASAEDVSATGIELERVVSEQASLEIERNAVLAFDGDRHTQLGSRAPGAVAEVLVDLGQEVEAGQALLLVDSAEVGEAKAALLRELAMVGIGQRDRDREALLLERGAGTERQALEAETRLAEAEIALVGARQRLRSLGLDEEAIEEVAAEGDTSSLLALRAPFAGTVVERRVALGQAVAGGEALLELADLSRMWLRIDLLEQDAGPVGLGRELTLVVDALPGERWSGELDWIGAGLDPRSRTLPARAVIPNPGGRLRAGMFGRVQVQLRDPEPSVLVAQEAVQWEGCCNIVFLPAGPASFRPRPVRIAFAQGDRYVIEDGLSAGEQVVTTGAFLLKTEILKGSIGAGCCETEAPKR